MTLYKQADNSYTEKSYVSLDGWVQSGWEIGHSGSIEDTYDYNEVTGLKFKFKNSRSGNDTKYTDIYIYCYNEETAQWDTYFITTLQPFMEGNVNTTIDVGTKKYSKIAVTRFKRGLTQC